MNIIIWLVVGGLIGWAASLVMRTQEGILLNVVVGIVGAALGGVLFGPYLGVSTINQGNFSNREQNVVQYWSPSIGGFEVKLAYTANEARTAGSFITARGSPLAILRPLSSTTRRWQMRITSPRCFCAVRPMLPWRQVFFTLGFPTLAHSRARSRGRVLR